MTRDEVLNLIRDSLTINISRYMTNDPNDESVYLRVELLLDGDVISSETVDLP